MLQCSLRDSRAIAVSACFAEVCRSTNVANVILCECQSIHAPMTKSARVEHPARGSFMLTFLFLPLSPASHAERVGRRPENHGSKPTTISVGFRGKAILGYFLLGLGLQRQNQAKSGQIKGSKRAENRGQFVVFQSN